MYNICKIVYYNYVYTLNYIIIVYYKSILYTNLYNTIISYTIIHIYIKIKLSNIIILNL